MPLPASGNPISFSNLNTELGNASGTELDLKSASEGFGEGVAPYGMDELQGLSFGRILQTIGYLDYDGQVGDPSYSEDTVVPYLDGELHLAAGAENVSGIVTATSDSYYNSDGGFSNGDILYLNNTGLTFPDFPSSLGGTPGLQSDGYLVNTTSNKVFYYTRSTSAVSNVVDRTPQIPTKPTTTAVSSTRIDVTIPSTNTVVTKTFKIQRAVDTGGGFGSYSDLTTISPSAFGNYSNTSVSTTYSDTSVSAGNSYKYQVRGQNNFANSNFSTPSDSVTAPTGTSWSLPTNFSLLVFSDTSTTDSTTSLLKTATLTNGSGTTSISCQQPTNGNIQLQVAASTTGDPGTSGTANSGTGFGNTLNSLANASTYYLRFKLAENKPNSGGQSSQGRTITFENNGVSDTFTLTVRVDDL